MLAKTILVTTCLALFAACGAKSGDDDGFEAVGPTYEYDEEGHLVRSFDIDGDGDTDVTKVFVQYPDPTDPSVTLQRLIRKDVDVNSDGKINMRRHYNDEGNLFREEVDSDLDGLFDLVNYIDGGHLARKELLNSQTGAVVASRFYLDGELVRVEQDSDGDGKIDYWEFYEEGVLDRIGRDLNGDQRADTWQRR